VDQKYNKWTEIGRRHTTCFFFKTPPRSWTNASGGQSWTWTLDRQDQVVCPHHLATLPPLCPVESHHHVIWNLLPKPTCQMLYNTLVLPLFDYCSPVWDSCGVGSKAYLDKLNRRAACIIEGRSIWAEELKSTLGWPSLQARRNILNASS